MTNLNYDRTTYDNPTEAERLDYEHQIGLLSNAELLEEFTYFAGGDSWDGECSTHGDVIYHMLDNALTSRLRKLGFFDGQ